MQSWQWACLQIHNIALPVSSIKIVSIKLKMSCKDPARATDVFIKIYIIIIIQELQEILTIWQRIPRKGIFIFLSQNQIT